MRPGGKPKKKQAAWGVFYERYVPLIRGWCAGGRLQKADADDLCHTILERLFRKISTYNPDRGRFRGWLRSVVENALRDFRRSRHRHPGDQGSGESDASERLQAIAQPETVDALIEGLDTSLRRDMDAVLARVEKDVQATTWRAFCLVVLEGREIKETAAQLGMTYGAVCTAITRVKKKLRAEGAKLGEHPQHPSEDQP